MRLRALGALAATATLLAGCGSTPPSLIQLRAQGTRICASTGRQLGLVGAPRSEAGGEAFLKRGLGLLGAELKQLRGLRAPAEGGDVYATALDALADELQALRGTVRALARQQDPVIAFKTLQQHLGPLESRADDAWRALQMPACLQR